MLFQLLYPFYKIKHPHAEAFVERNLQNAGFPQITAREVHQNLFQNAIDSFFYLKSSSLNSPKIVKNILFENDDILKAEIAKGNPVVAVSIHLGAFEMLHRSLTRFGRPVHLLASKLKYPWVNHLLLRLRSAPGIVLHPPSEAAAALKQTIQQREILALMLDQSKDPKGNEVTLFGRNKKLFLRLPLAANRMGASVVGFYVKSLGGGRHCVCFSRAFAPGTEEEALRCGLVGLVEEWIRDAPAHFAWNYR
jgi:KDO2-lipid IV(A) lauroyltransferase